MTEKNERYEEKVFANISSNDAMRTIGEEGSNGAISTPDVSYLRSLVTVRKAIDKMHDELEESELQQFRMKYNRNTTTGVNIFANRKKDQQPVAKPVIVVKKRKIESIEARPSSLNDASQTVPGLKPEAKMERIVEPAVMVASSIFGQYNSSDDET